MPEGEMVVMGEVLARWGQLVPPLVRQVEHGGSKRARSGPYCPKAKDLEGRYEREHTHKDTLNNTRYYGNVFTT